MTRATLTPMRQLAAALGLGLLAFGLVFSFLLVVLA